MLLIIISGLVAAVCFLKWSKIKKDLFQVAGASQAPLIEEKEEAELLTKPPVIPEPPPPPPPVELGEFYFQFSKWIQFLLFLLQRLCSILRARRTRCSCLLQFGWRKSRVIRFTKNILSGIRKSRRANLSHKKKMHTRKGRRIH